MAAREITEYPEKVLGKIGEPVTEFGEELETLCGEMFETICCVLANTLLA